MGQGKTFEIPEKVPFRLTHNMVEAMGVNGVEGKFPFQFLHPLHDDERWLCVEKLTIRCIPKSSGNQSSNPQNEF
jgi:hypothetical protein